jgi:hypothetical protein
MKNGYIISEPMNEQFREFLFNADAESGMQIVEQLHDYQTVLNAYQNSSNNEEFAAILDAEAKTFLHDAGSNEFNILDTYLKSLKSYMFLSKDRILMTSFAMANNSTCKNCIHHARCEAIYEQNENRSCSEDPVKDCDFFIHQSLIK